MATHFSILDWITPWTEEPGAYSPWGHMELEAGEGTECTAHKGLHLFFDILIGFPRCSFQHGVGNNYLFT